MTKDFKGILITTGKKFDPEQLGDGILALVDEPESSVFRVTGVASADFSAGDLFKAKEEKIEFLYTKLDNPNTLPTGNGYSCTYNPSGTRLAIGHANSPTITIYDITAIPYTKLPDPTTLPAGYGYGCAYNHDGTRLAVAHSASPFVTVYDTTTTPYTKLADPTTLPASSGRGCTYNHNGTRLAIAHHNSPFITIYDTTTTPYTKITNPNTLPANSGMGCAFNHNGTRLAVAHTTSPYITVYDTTTVPYTKLADPTTLPASSGRGCTYNPSSTRLAIAHDTSPYITIYDTTTTPYIALANPSALPTGDANDCSYNPDGTRLTVAHINSPFITIYDSTTTPYKKLETPLGLPTSSGYGCAYSNDGKKLAIANIDTPFLTTYALYESRVLLTEPSTDRIDKDYIYFGYAETAVAKGAVADFVLLHKLGGGGGEGTFNHAELKNLDFASSGHTGFQVALAQQVANQVMIHPTTQGGQPTAVPYYGPGNILGYTGNNNAAPNFLMTFYQDSATGGYAYSTPAQVMAKMGAVSATDVDAKIAAAITGFLATGTI